jgi:hypothetical protein
MLKILGPKVSSRPAKRFLDLNPNKNAILESSQGHEDTGFAAKSSLSK